MSFRNWYIRNQDAITWFIIGWTAFAGIDSLIHGNYAWAAFDAVIIWANVKLANVRL
jgi:hypothetical protein